MTPIEQLRSTLATLSLTAIDARLDALLETAAKKEPSYADFLAEVILHALSDPVRAAIYADIVAESHLLPFLIPGEFTSRLPGGESWD